MPKRNSTAAPRRDPKSGTWWFIVDLGPGPNGKGEWKERRQAFRRGYATKQAAQEVLNGLRVEATSGTYVAPVNQTVKEFLEEDWLPAARIRLADSTYESYERNVRHHVVPHIGGRKLQSVDGTTLNRLYALLLESGRKRGKQSPGLKPRTVRYIHTIVHSAFGDAVKWRKLTVNPADHAKPPSAKSARAPEMKTWTSTELATFLRRTAGDRYGFAWSFLATTGCRRGEALGLRWSDVDLTKGLASIRQQVVPVPKSSGKGREGRIVPGTKTGHARVIELDSRTVLDLRRWKKLQAKERLAFDDNYEDNKLVFPRWDGRPFHPEFFSKTFDRRLRQKAFEDLPTIRLHDLRHTWATLALEAGIDVAIVSKQLGHASPTVTWNTYQHVRKAMKADAVRKVADLIFGSDNDDGEAAASA
jgi:integrase